MLGVRNAHPAPAHLRDQGPGTHARPQARARDAIGEEVTEARLVHDLAVRGAQLVTDERTRRRAALERMADPDRGGLDLELLGQVEQIGMEDLPDPTSP